MSFAALLDSKVDIKRRSTTPDSMGGGDAETYTTLYTNVPCRFEDNDKREMIQAYDKKSVFPDYWIYLEYLSGIREGDRFVKGTREFEIKLIGNWSEQNEKMRIAITEIRRHE